LADLLMDFVDSGASGGFMPPLGQAEALAYCHTVIATVPLDEVLAAMNYGDRSTA
jgi:hypothetical protein